MGVLHRAGAKAERTSALLPDFMDATRLYMRLLMSTVAASYPVDVYEDYRSHAATLDRDDNSLRAERIRGAVLSHRDWIATDHARAQLQEQWRKVFTQFDIVICPASPTTAFVHEHSGSQWERKIDIDGKEYDYPDQLAWAGIATAPGLPATAMPIGHDKDGLPIGVQLIGPMYGDLTTLHFAQVLEQELAGFIAPPMPW